MQRAPFLLSFCPRKQQTEQKDGCMEELLSHHPREWVLICDRMKVVDLLVLRLVCRKLRVFFSFAWFRQRLSLRADPSKADERVLRDARYLAWLDFWDVATLQKRLHWFRFHQGLERLVQGYLRGVGYVGTRARGVLTAYCQPSEAWRKRVLAAKGVKFKRDDYYCLRCEFTNGAPGRVSCECSTQYVVSALSFVR
jgi:hypothetical protein